MFSQEFRYNSRKEYEKELEKILTMKNERDLDVDVSKDLEQEYESLVEEYLKFCEND